MQKPELPAYPSSRKLNAHFLPVEREDVLVAAFFALLDVESTSSANRLANAMNPKRIAKAKIVWDLSTLILSSRFVAESFQQRNFYHPKIKLRSKTVVRHDGAGVLMHLKNLNHLAPPLHPCLRFPGTLIDSQLPDGRAEWLLY
ncbi:hypothetical protein TNIN_403091 [Trichonephila inaurata madagascariensis]|uniref:Uncharacterized protein n=1 Tax=Trichonephila inaurata madagascariensis TaxID=2747483 RepID=A0A8X7BTD4_9ARAC|nr:hypothetical protein TNIN_403091 [Trichonephila inaurata madagascariensis]